MAQVERSVGQPEEKSLWNSRLFKVGFVAVSVGWFINSAALLTVGFAAMGGAWVLKKGE